MSGTKRAFGGPQQDAGNKRSKVEDDAKREEMIQRARERIAKLKAEKAEKEEKDKAQADRAGKGLNVELHPLLGGKAQPAQAAGTENPNLAKLKSRGFAINPYLDGSLASGGHRRHRELAFSEPGKYIAQAEELRKKEKLAEIKRSIEERTRKAGLEPKKEIGEELYKLEKPPAVEWWDMDLLVNGDYANVKYDEITRLIQHPIPISAPWLKNQPELRPMFLTKKEMKRLRRNNRAVKYQELQDKIKLGLEPPPPPKVKLSNLMNVLTSEAIKDPTAVEQRVREEVRQREIQHYKENEERRLTKEQKHEKLEKKFAKDLDKGIYSKIFIVKQLVHPSHKFKVDKNAEQLKLNGLLLYVNEFALIIVEGGEKSVNNYGKLMNRRINWQEPFNNVTLAGNYCKEVWSGSIKDFNFKKWSIFRTNSIVDGIEYLKRFGVDNYLRQVEDEAEAAIQTGN